MSELRWIWIDGPPLLRDDDPLKPRGVPFWSLQVGASYFGRDNAADYAHPLRTLMVDARTTNVNVNVEKTSAFFETGKLQHALRAPRLFDVHLIAGAGKDPYRPNANVETLQVNGYPGGTRIGGVLVNDDAGKPRFSTVGGQHEGGGADAQEGFVHIVAEPQLVAETQKGDFIDQAGHAGNDSEKGIRVPRLRLLHGAIRLRVTGPLPWLGNIDPGKAFPGAPKAFELILTPSGIEIVTAVEFPGATDKLRGVFLIAPRDPREMLRDRMTGDDAASRFKPSALTLTLLPSETGQLPVEGAGAPPISLWMDAWRNAAAPALPDDDNQRCGIDIRTLPSNLPPRLRWTLYVKKDATAALVAATVATADPPLAVDAPVDRLRIELRGSRGPDGTHEGAAVLMTSRLRIATRLAAPAVARELYRQKCLDKPQIPQAPSGTVIFAEARPELSSDASATQIAEPKYWTVSTIEAAKSVEMSLLIGSGTSGTIALAHDEHRLAASLRAAVGWEEPQPQQLAGGNLAPFTQAHRPVISGFVPLDRGWLQLPFPNLPPLDIQKDSSLLGALDPTPTSVLDGFIRIAHRPVIPFLSGYQTVPGGPVGDTAPWSVTVEGAGVAVVMAAVHAGGLAQTRVVLREPDLAARGLVWLSADRPDALEALPRLGAGPGSFFDIDFTTTPAPDPKIRVVTASLGALTLTYEREGTATRNDLNIAVAFNPAAADWDKGLAGTAAGRNALARAREVLLGKASAQSGLADLATLRQAQSDAECALAALEVKFAKAEQQRVTLAAQVAGESSKQAGLDARRKALVARQTKARTEADAAKAANESERILEADAVIADVERALAELVIDAGDNAARLTALKAEKAKLDGDANVRSEIVRVARVNVEKTSVAFASADGGTALIKNPQPWPAVAWLRHPRLPFAAGMPMTRAAASAVAPLESREFAPFVAATDFAGNFITLATLNWKGTQAFPDIGASPVFERLAEGWPRPDVATDTEVVLGPSRGVPFAAFGVPGTEVMPPVKMPKQWGDLDFAVRYDLPSLDEAFATAGLPPVEEPLPQEDERDKAADKPIATALDWPLMQNLWDDQERRRNLSLVIDSYLDNFHPAADPQLLQVLTLIRGAAWSIKVKFDANYSLNGLPYGAVTFGEPSDLRKKVLSANTALMGLSGKLSFKSAKVIEFNANAPGTPVFEMLGWSPSSFDNGDFRFDTQGFGIANPRSGGGVLTRRYRGGLGAGDKIFASAEQLVEIQGVIPFRFWFKDLPLNASGAFDRRADNAQTGVPETAIDFKAWLSPEEGYEWRLHRGDTSAAFEGGRDRIPFFGVDIEPLRLLKLQLPMSQGLPTSCVPQSIEILARVFFTDNADQPITGGNLIIMSFVAGTGALHLESIAGVGKTPMPLMFAFEAKGAGRTRRVLLQAAPAFIGDRLILSNASLSLSIHGRNILLKNASIKCDDEAGGSMTITWTPGATDPMIEPSQGRLRVMRLSIVSEAVTGQRKATLKLDRVVEICSARAQRGSPEVVAQFNEVVPSCTFGLLNSKFDDVQTLREDDQALVVVWKNSNVTGLAGLLPGLTTGSDPVGVALMLAATVDAPLSEFPWILPLGCGRCEGEIRAKDKKEDVSNALHTRRIRWEIDGQWSVEKPRKLIWDGFVAISGTLQQTSAITWPRLITAKGGTDGRRRVKPVNGGKPLAHQARYVFDDHRLPLEVCRRSAGKWTFYQPWTAFVSSHHKLTESADATTVDQATTVLEWSGLESFAIGRAADLIPALPAGTTIEAVTFAARYRRAYVGASSNTAKMMIQPGLGAIQTVLQGMSGKEFREAFWNLPGDKEIVAAAGFIGVQMSDRTDRNAEEPLLRLPFLAGLGVDSPLKPGALSQSEFPPSGIEVAWVDSAAARSLLVRDGHAVAPASAIEADLIAALRAGALIDEDGGLPKGEIAAALAVEQSFTANPPEEAVLVWANAPYWIGSAVTVSRAVDRYTRADARPFRPLSLVAGSVLRGERARGTAALMRALPAKILQQPPPDAIPALISGGTALAVEDWPGLDPGKAENSSINGYAVGLAAARHARPLFAVVRYVEATDGVAHYTPIVLPRAARADLPSVRQGSRDQTRFAEGARGYATGPGDAITHWLYPVVEGQIGAVRDEKSSGLAGLGRKLALPVQAGKQIGGLIDEEQQEELARSLVWFTEKRNPVYLPLGINGMESPPIPWLQSASPRVRLPNDSDVAMVLYNSGLGDDTRASKRMAAQSFLPDAIDALAVSERAGIVTARRVFLMGVVPHEHVFDAEQTRFGRAGQAGSSVRRWMRTPRPAQLPANTGDPDRDRRPEASPLLPLVPLRFLVGPADTVRGSTDGLPALGKSVPWSATIVAAPLSDGVVSDRWDGSVRLTVELDIAAGVQAPMPGDARVLLTRLLFPSKDDDQHAQAQGSLKVNDELFRLKWITVQERSSAWVALSPAGVAPAATDPIVWRACVDLIVDPHETKPALGAGMAGVHAGLAAALSAGAFAIELRLTVHPTEVASDAPAPIAIGQAVALAIADQDALAIGKERPPLTLRWTLPAVTATKGSMPLLPSTLLFVDPVYETGLANPPYEKSVLLDTKNVKDLPANRGAARAFFSADRGRVNRRGTVAFMADVRFERQPEALSPFTDGDFKSATATFVLLLKLIPREPGNSIRFLTIGGKGEAPVALACVYELSLAALTEADGSPARLKAGDVLELTITEGQPEQVRVTMHNSETGGETGEIKLSQKPGPNVPKPPEGQSSRGFGLSLPLTLTEEPVVEPPAALYAALIRTNRKGSQPTLSLPLYAQSPLPWRVDFRNLKRDFRAGVVHRSATFVWGLSRSLVDMKIGDASVRAHIVKIDRNGQSQLPESADEFRPPDRLRIG